MNVARTLWLLLSVLWLPAWAAEAALAEPVMPEEVTLTSGRVLRRVQVIRWEEQRVVLKHSAGADPIAFNLFKSPAPAELAALRVAALARAVHAAKPTSATVELSGQVFVTTRGAGAYKFSGAKVRAYPAAAWESMRIRQSTNLASNYRRASPQQQEAMEANAWIDATSGEAKIAEVTSDADGHYRLILPANQEVFLVCAAGRIVGRNQEQNVWAVKVPAGATRLDLNSSNEWEQPD